MSAFFLSLGSNLGDRKRNLEQIIDFLKKEKQISISKISPFYETEPWQAKDHPWYINICVGGETSLNSLDLLEKLQEIEKALGRDHTKKLAPRVIDIDLLFYDGITLESQALTLPHPRLSLRRFVLQPLADIAPDFLHPVLKKTVKELLEKCEDRSIVRQVK